MDGPDVWNARQRGPGSVEGCGAANAPRGRVIGEGRQDGSRVSAWRNGGMEDWHGNRPLEKGTKKDAVRTVVHSSTTCT